MTTATKPAANRAELPGPLRWQKTPKPWHSGAVVCSDDTVPSLVLVVEHANALLAERETLRAALRFAAAGFATIANSYAFDGCRGITPTVPDSLRSFADENFRAARAALSELEARHE